MSGTPFFRYVDGVGSTNLNVNGSVTPVLFTIAPLDADTSTLGVDEINIKLYEAIIYVEDQSPFGANTFGALNALTNGVNFSIYNEADDTVRFDLMGGRDIKTNAGWSRVCYDVEFFTFGSGNNYMAARWTFTRSGAPLTIGRDAYFGVKVADDLTGLAEFQIQLQGEVKT